MFLPCQTFWRCWWVWWSWRGLCHSGHTNTASTDNDTRHSGISITSDSMPLLEWRPDQQWC